MCIHRVEVCAIWSRAAWQLHSRLLSSASTDLTMNYQTLPSRWLALSCAGALALAPALSHAAEPNVGAAPEGPRPERARKLLIAGGVLGGVGLVATALGFGIHGGIHLGNPGPGQEIQTDDPANGRGLVRTANTMLTVGGIGASLLITGAILAAIGGSSMRRARASRVSGMVGPRSLSLMVRF